MNLKLFATALTVLFEISYNSTLFLLDSRARVRYALVPIWITYSQSASAFLYSVPLLPFNVHQPLLYYSTVTLSSLRFAEDQS